jgi:hypothetical protein
MNVYRLWTDDRTDRISVFDERKRAASDYRRAVRVTHNDSLPVFRSLVPLWVLYRLFVDVRDRVLNYSNALIGAIAHGSDLRGPLASGPFSVNDVTVEICHSSI